MVSIFLFISAIKFVCQQDDLKTYLNLFILFNFSKELGHEAK